MAVDRINHKSWGTLLCVSLLPRLGELSRPSAEPQGSLVSPTLCHVPAIHGPLSGLLRSPEPYRYPLINSPRISPDGVTAGSCEKLGAPERAEEAHEALTIVVCLA